MLPLWLSSVVVCASWWSSANEASPPVVAVSIAPDGEAFAPWATEEDGSDPLSATPECAWWNGTYYYAPGLCNHMSVTRMSKGVAQQAVERATRCAVHGTTDCILSGEIGFNVPAAFVYDEVNGMRMIVAPKMLEVEGAALKTVRLQDPTSEHPNQLFEFRNEVRVEYLVAAGRTMETLELRGNDAYCLQALRRAVVPTCWESLD